MGFPGFDYVYRMADPLDDGFRARVSLAAGDALRALRGDYVPDRVQAHWAMGMPFPRDVVYVDNGISVLLGPRVLGVLREAHVSGWESYPVSLHDGEGSPVPGYHGLVLTGRCGALQFNRSVPERAVGPRGRDITVYRGLYFDELAWDGSDVFASTDPVGAVFVVDEVKRLLTSAGVTGTRYERLSSALRMLKE